MHVRTHARKQYARKHAQASTHASTCAHTQAHVRTYSGTHTRKLISLFPSEIRTNPAALYASSDALTSAETDVSTHDNEIVDLTGDNSVSGGGIDYQNARALIHTTSERFNTEMSAARFV